MKDTALGPVASLEILWTVIPTAQLQSIIQENQGLYGW